MLRQFARTRDDAFEKMHELLLAVLAAFAQFARDAPTLLAEICSDRRVTVVPFVCPAHALFFSAGIVHRKHVHIQGDVFLLDRLRARTVSHDDRRDRPPNIGDEIYRGLVDERKHRARMLVETLAQARLRRHGLDTQGRREKRVVSPVLDRREITFSRAQQADIARHAVGVRDAVAQRDRRQVRRKPRHAERAADQCQAGMGRRRVRVGLYDLEAPHRTSPAGCNAHAMQDSRFASRVRSLPEPARIRLTEAEA